MKILTFKIQLFSTDINTIKSLTLRKTLISKTVDNNLLDYEYFVLI